MQKGQIDHVVHHVQTGGIRIDILQFQLVHTHVGDCFGDKFGSRRAAIATNGLLGWKLRNADLQTVFSTAGGGGGVIRQHTRRNPHVFVIG